MYRAGLSFVNSIVVDPTNNIYAGGNFEHFRGGTNNANKIAKFSSAGVFDQSFSDTLDVSPGIKSATTSGFKSGTTIVVNSMVMDGTSLYIVGRFSAFKNGINNANKIAKLSLAGVFDQAFSDNLDVNFSIKAANSGFGNISSQQIYSIAIDKNNDLIVAGLIDTFKNEANNARGIAKLSKTGIFNQSFSNNLDVSISVKSTTSGFTGASTNVSNITVDASNNIYAAGDFTSFRGLPAQYYIKLLNSGLEP